MKFDGMIKSIILVIAGIIILTSFTEVLAQENISVLLGKNVKEWHSIGIALISEGKHEEAIKYYDKILELNPNDEKALVNKGSILKDLERYEEAIKYYDKILELNPKHVKALANKGLSYASLLEWSEAEKFIFRAVELEPDNKDVQSIKFQFFKGAPSRLAHDSVFDINLRVTVRDSSGNLVSVSEASNTRYLPYSITEEVFERYMIEENIVLDGKVYDIAQKTDLMTATDDATGLFGLSVTKYGHEFDVFLGFAPMIFTEIDDKITIEWRILKELV